MIQNFDFYSGSVSAGDRDFHYYVFLLMNTVFTYELCCVVASCPARFILFLNLDFPFFIRTAAGTANLPNRKTSNVFVMTITDRRRCGRELQLLQL